MKKLFLISMIMMITILSFSQSTEKNSSLDYYQSTDGSVYFIGDKLTIGQPSLSDKTFAFVIDKDKPNSQALVSGNKIIIENFYLKDNNVIMVGKLSSGTEKYVIVFENAIKNGELLSFDVTMKSNDKNL